MVGTTKPQLKETAAALVARFENYTGQGVVYLTHEFDSGGMDEFDAAPLPPGGELLLHLASRCVDTTPCVDNKAASGA
jgi:hypothetical protein